MTDSTSPIRYLTVAETAKLLRAALKEAFPGIRFSVRSDKYAGGASIDVYWTDGPTPDQVEQVTARYRGADFDGMTDSMSYHDTLLAGPDGNVESVHFGADFIPVHRDLSPEFRAWLTTIAEGALGGPLEEGRWYDGDYVTDYGIWQGATGYALVRWLGERVPTEV